MRVALRLSVAAWLALWIIGCMGMPGSSMPSQEMSMSGTLTRTAPSDGAEGTYFLSTGMGMSYGLDVSQVRASAEQLVGRQVAVTGRMDTASAGATPKIIVTRLEALEGAPGQ